MLTEFNQQLFSLINATPDASKSMIVFAIGCAQYLIYLPILVAVFYWFKKPTSRIVILKIVTVIIATLFVTAILRMLIVSPRPFELGIGTNYLSHSSSNSFPSKHAAFIWAFTFALFQFSKQHILKKVAFITCFITALSVCWARIYLGIHWPLDILAAIAVSFYLCLYDK